MRTQGRGNVWPDPWSRSAVPFSAGTPPRPLIACCRYPRRIPCHPRPGTRRVSANECVIHGSHGRGLPSRASISERPARGLSPASTTSTCHIAGGWIRDPPRHRLRPSRPNGGYSPIAQPRTWIVRVARRTLQDHSSHGKGGSPTRRGLVALEGGFAHPDPRPKLPRKLTGFRISLPSLEPRHPSQASSSDA